MAYLDYPGLQHYDEKIKEYIDEVPAQPDGNYHNMTVGNADQLTSTMYVEDSVPYLYRTSGGSKDIGDREYLEIVGGSVGWNQQLNYTDEVVAQLSSTDMHVLTNDPPDTSHSYVNYVQGHKYLFLYEQLTTMTSNTRNTPYYNDGSTHFQSSADNYRLSAGKYSWIFEATTSKSDGVLGIWVHTPSVESTYKTFNCFDLTLMFGSTLADYIYTLETATAGAGVAKLKSWGFFTKDYYAYDAGSLKSVEGLESHETVGFNQWDEVWEQGNINSSGQPSPYSQYFRTKNFIPVISGANYYQYSETNDFIYRYFYDANKSYIGTFQSSKNFTFTVPVGACFMKFVNTARETYNNDICINLSWSGYRNGEYEPYVKHSYPLDSSLTLRGIPKKDDDGNLYFDGDVYSADGTVQRRFGVVDLGTLDWSYATLGSVNLFYAPFSLIKTTGYTNSSVFPIVCSKYLSVAFYSGGVYMDNSDKRVAYAPGDGNCFYVTDSNYTDATTFKTAMSGIYLVYELATPTTETADPFQSPQIVDDFGTEEFVTDSIVPVGHATKYPANLRERIESIPVLPTTAGNYRLQVTIVSGKPVYEWVTT